MRRKDRIALADGDEYDYLTNARRYFSIKPGQIKWLQRKYNKRARKLAKQEVEVLGWENGPHEGRRQRPHDSSDNRETEPVEIDGLPFPKRDQQGQRDARGHQRARNERRVDEE